MADYTLSAKITGDASGFKGAIASAQASINQLQDKVSSAGKKLQSIGSSVSGVGDALTSKITKPALVATSALAGIALVKGFDRLTGIDDARAKLMGLGHDAESVDKIMKSAVTSVKGTAFGMAEAATTAAGAVAAGVQQGDELTRYLSLTADAAAIAGTSMDEMGSIVNKVTTSGRAMTENLEQLSDRGLPIYQWLGDAAGVAASEIKDMASDGKISSEMFLAAIEKNIGGAAQIMGQNSFKSTIANIGASIGRIGANFLDAGGKGGGFFSTLKPLLADFNNKLGVVEDKAAELGVKFGESFQKVISVAQSLKDKFDSLSPPIQQIITKGALIGTGIAVGMGPALKIVGTLTSSLGGVITVLSAFISPIGLVVAAIVSFGVAVGVAMAKSESFRNKVIGIGQSVGETLQMVKQLAQGFLTMITDGPGEKIADLKEKFVTLFPEELWNKMINFSNRINDVIATIKALVGVITGSIGDIGSLGDTLGGVLDYDQESALFEIGTKIKSSLETAKEALSNFGSSITPLISSMFSNIGPLISSALSGIGPAIGTAFNGIKEVISTVLPIVQGFVSGFTNGFSTMSGNAGSSILQIIGFIKMFTSPLSMVMKLFQEFGPQIVSAFSEVGTMLIPLFTNLGQTIGNLAASVIPILAGAITTLMPVIMQIASTVGNIIMTVLPVVIQLMTQLLPVITQIITVVVQLAAALMPIIADLVSALLPVIMNIITALMNIVTAVAPVLISIIQTIITIVQALIPVITSIISVVANVVSNVITAISMVITIVANVIATIISIISPIIAFIAGIISSIIAAISPIIAAVSGVFSTVFSIISDVWNNIMNTVSTIVNAIGGVISGLSSVVSGVFNTIFSTISSVMNNVSTTISGVFDAIQNSWTGLTSFVSGVFDGISSAVESLVNQVKGFVNGVIGGVNSAIGIINKIPGVSIGEIPYLQSGTTSWQGGFARMNEGGRGEMVLLPSGSQVIPHDVSMQYARESAKRNSSNQFIDVTSKEESKQPINVYITNEGNEEFIRTYVNTENATDDMIRIFNN